MSVLVNLFLRGIGMTLKMSAYEILQIENQHRLNLNVHLCILNGLFTSHPICWFLCYQHSSISMSLLERRRNLGVHVRWEFIFFLFAKNYISVLLIYCSFPGGFPFWRIVWFLLVTLFCKKSSNTFTCVPVLCQGFSFRAWNSNYVAFNNISSNYMLDILSGVHATVLDFFLKQKLPQILSYLKKTWGAYFYMYSMCCFLREEL